MLRLTLSFIVACALVSAGDSRALAAEQPSRIFRGLSGPILMRR